MTLDINELGTERRPDPPPWAHFELLVSRLADGVTVQDASGRLVYANEIAARMSGYGSPTDLLTAPVGDYARRYDVTDASGLPVTVNDLPGRRALRLGHAEAILRVRDRVSGAERWNEVRAFAVHDETGAAEFVVNIIRDVTAHVESLQAAEAASQAAQEHAKWLSRLQQLTVGLSRSLTVGDAIDIATSLGRRLFEADTVGLWLFGDESSTLRLVGHHGFSEEIVGRYATVALSAPFPIAETARNGEPVLIENRAALVSRYAEAGEVIPSEGGTAIACGPVKVGGAIIGVLAYLYFVDRAFTDDFVTALRTFSKELGQALDRTRIHAELEAAKRSADAASQAKSSFLATMSHELRTPINAILGFTDLLDLGIADGEKTSASEYVGRIRKNSQHLLDLINDVLDWSKVEAGQLAIESGQELAHEVITDAANVVRDQAAARGISFRWNCADGTSYLGDPLRVRQVLLNLLSNAIKFTPAGGSVTLSCDGNGDVTRFVVEDTGIGIAAKDFQAIFEPFVQSDDVYTRRFGGTGLGLSISRRLAQLMGGDVTVESTLGQGARFTLTLPSGETSR